jgi:hypothetical protein
MKKGLVFLAVLILMSAQPLQGQEPEQEQERGIQDADLPRWVEEDVIDFFNDEETIHFTGRSRVPTTRSILGNVAALGGPFTVAGVVEGDLVVVNGDLVFEEGGSVSGDVLIVGGRVVGEELGRIAGGLRVFSEPLRYVQSGDRISAARRSERDRNGRLDQDYSWGRANLVVKTGQNYNRVEGLPVIFGPSIRTGGSNPFRLDIWGIWRTEMGLELDEEDFGYLLRGEQAFGGREDFSIGGTFYSYVDPIEDWGISNLEASLATFILHKDFRDYYEREGFSVFAEVRIPSLPVELKAEYFQEDHLFMPVEAPWSVTKNDEPWRNQPLVAQGEMRFIEGSLILDTRNSRSDPTDGWYMEARSRFGLSGDLTLPAHRTSPEDQAALIPPEEYETDFITGFLDLRSYNRVSPGASLNLRGVLGGTLNDTPLPPQYQHAFGGVGSLPGFPLFAGDCGARSIVRGYDIPAGEDVIRDPVFPRYGCDQMALFQAEFRGRLFIDWDFGWGDDEDEVWDDDWSWYPRVEFAPDWTVFFNAGKGWTVDGMGETETLMDLGLGLYLGDLGVHYAFPLTEDASGDRDGIFFIRLTRRF